MASARELLDQADALMRRNRAGIPAGTAVTEIAIPELTDAVGTDDADFVGEDSVGDFGVPPPAPAAGGGSPLPAAASRSAMAPQPAPLVTEAHTGPDSYPLLTEAIAASDAADRPAAEPAPVPHVPADSTRIPDAAHWERLAEEVRMQVLQRIDIFTDTGLQEQLKEKLQPIVDRASADLIATINRQVGQLLRAYVAEAIEREIDKWRQDSA